MHLSLQILTAFALLQPQVAVDSQRSDRSTEKSPVTAQAVAEGSGTTNVAPDLQKENTLGVRAKTIPDLLRSQLGELVPRKSGVLVAAVAPRSAAMSAGLKQHNLLLKFADNNILSPAHLKQMVGNAKPGATVELTILRTLKTQTVLVKLGIRSVNVADRGLTAYGPQPAGRPRHYCKVEVVFDSDERLIVTTEQCVDGAPAMKDDFTGLIDDVAAHYESAPAVVRNNISICLATLRPDQRTKVRPSVRILPRVENRIRFVRFVNVRMTPAGLPSVYIYDKRMGVTTAPGSLAGVTKDKAVRDELDKLPKPVRERIDQTVRQFKDAASVKSGPALP